MYFSLQSICLAFIVICVANLIQCKHLKSSGKYDSRYEKGLNSTNERLDASLEAKQFVAMTAAPILAVLLGSGSLATGLTSLTLGIVGRRGAADTKQRVEDLDYDISQLATTLSATLEDMAKWQEYVTYFGDAIQNCQTFQRYSKHSLLVEDGEEPSRRAIHDAKAVIASGPLGADHALRLFHQMITGDLQGLGRRSIFEIFRERLDDRDPEYVAKLIDFITFIVRLQQSCYHALKQADEIVNKEKPLYDTEKLYADRRCKQTKSIKRVLDSTFPYYWSETNDALGEKGTNVFKLQDRIPCALQYNNKAYVGSVLANNECKIAYDIGPCVFGDTFCRYESKETGLLYNRCKTISEIKKIDKTRKSKKTLVTLDGKEKVCVSRFGFNEYGGSAYYDNFGVEKNNQCEFIYLAKTDMIGKTPSTRLPDFEYLDLECDVTSLYKRRKSAIELDDEENDEECEA